MWKKALVAYLASIFLGGNPHKYVKLLSFGVEIQTGYLLVIRQKGDILSTTLLMSTSWRHTTWLFSLNHGPLLLCCNFCRSDYTALRPLEHIVRTSKPRLVAWFIIQQRPRTEFLEFWTPVFAFFLSRVLKVRIRFWNGFSLKNL